MADVLAKSGVKSRDWLTPGIFWLFIAIAGGAALFSEGLDTLRSASSLPQYSHGPLIPILSGLFFLKQLRDFPVDAGPRRQQWLGVTVIVVALALATLGKPSSIAELVASAMIATAILMIGATPEWQDVPARGTIDVSRDGVSKFPRQFGDWEPVGQPHTKWASVEETLGADDYTARNYKGGDAAASAKLFLRAMLINARVAPQPGWSTCFSNPRIRLRGSPQKPAFEPHENDPTQRKGTGSCRNR